MKLIYCPLCHDLIRLNKHIRFCICNESSGKYLEDELNAEYYGKAIPLGLDNNQFVEALKNQPKDGLGKRFEAFIIPKKCDTFKYKRK